MKIFIIANYVTFNDEKGSCRFTHLAEMFALNGHDVTLFTSTFSHRLKIQRDETKIKKQSNGKYDIIFIKEPNYKSHLGLKRFISINRFGENLKIQLEKEKIDPDFVYIGFPTFKSANSAVVYAKKKNIPTAIDIIDIWPEALLSINKLPNFLFNLLVLPWSIKANKIYKSVNAIIGVSDTYVNRAKKVNKTAHSLSVFLGSNLDYFDNCPFTEINKEGEIWLVYIGTISYSYDIITILKAAAILKEEKKINNIRFKIIGSGPHKEHLEKLAITQKLPVDFIGFIDYDKTVNYLKNSNVALNAIVKGAQQSITYKIGDYVSAGLPILNCSDNKEFKKMVIEKKLGINYEPGNPKDLSEKIKLILKDKVKLKLYASNSRKIAELKFNKRKTNLKIIQLIESIVN